MNKQKLTKQLDTIAKNVAKKGVYVVTKKDDHFVIQEHISKAIVASELPMKCVASYLCRLRNKGLAVSLGNKIKLEGLITQYFRCRNDIMFYRHTIKTTKDFTKLQITEARLLDTICKFNYTKEELKRFS